MHICLLRYLSPKCQNILKKRCTPNLRETRTKQVEDTRKTKASRPNQDQVSARSILLKTVKGSRTMNLWANAHDLVPIIREITVMLVLNMTITNQVRTGEHTPRMIIMMLEPITLSTLRTTPSRKVKGKNITSRQGIRPIGLTFPLPTLLKPLFIAPLDSKPSWMRRTPYLPSMVKPLPISRISWTNCMPIAKIFNCLWWTLPGLFVLV